MSSTWQPTEITGFVDHFDTACSVLLVDTDAGRGYLKAMGNLAGNHALACEWLGTSLAQRLGLPTFDMAFVEVRTDDILHFARGGRALPGPGVIFRAEFGDPWSGSEEQLRMIENPEAITRLLVLDTWVRNQDRYTPSGVVRNFDNVFLSAESQNRGGLILRPIDHTHCLIPAPAVDFTLTAADLLDPAVVEDPGVYGLFPEFRAFVDRGELQQTLVELAAISRGNIESVVAEIPLAWGVSAEVQTALVDFLVRRRQYVVDTIEKKVAGLLA